MTLTALLIVTFLLTSNHSFAKCITDKTTNNEESTTANSVLSLSGDVSTLVNTAASSATAATCQCTMPDRWHAQSGQDKFLFERLFFQQGLCCKGVFVEFGALNGIDHSNTYAFERYMGWKGLMFEIDPHVYRDLEQNRPGADIVIGAVCPSGESNITVILSIHGGLSGSIKQYEESRLHMKREESVVKCYNLADELRKRDMMRVDYLTMDTEGSEVDLVLDFPWDDFDVRMVQIEQLNEGKYTSQVGKKEKIIQHMISHGYELYHVFVVAIDDTDDLMFVRNLPRFDLNTTKTS
jgi:FkbM family methyltransferase